MRDDFVFSIQKAILSTVLHWDLNIDGKKVAMFELDSQFFDVKYKAIIEIIKKYQNKNIYPDFLLVANKVKNTNLEMVIMDIGVANPLGSYESLELYYNELKQMNIHHSLNELRYFA